MPFDVTVPIFSGGMNSSVHPRMIESGQLANAENIMFSRGMISTRSGKRMLASISGKNLQGGKVFSPSSGAPVLVIAVDGKIYTAKYPEYEFTRVQGLSFSPTAKRIYMERCVKSVKRNDDGTLTAIAPKRLLVIRDGVTKSGVYDGATGKHVTAAAPEYGVPIGTHMLWAHSRLWGITDNAVIASDLGDPTSFTENTYLAERSNFGLSGEGTGICQTTDNSSILVFTEDSTTALKAFILDRTTWATTDDFQKVIIPNVGCVSGSTAVNSNGVTYWLSKFGVMSLDAALATNQSSRVIPIDTQMDRYKSITSRDMSGACAIAHSNMVFFAMPVGGSLNERTMVLDCSSGVDTWSGVWSGTRPAFFTSGTIGMRDRMFAGSVDYSSVDDTKIHIWEWLRDDRNDNDGRIRCQIETKAFTFDSPVRFEFAEIELCGIEGDVDILAFVGVEGGPWVEVMNTSIKSKIGCIGSDEFPEIESGKPIFAFKPQSRTIRTKEMPLAGDDTECSPELGEFNNLRAGNSIQMLIEWSGVLNISSIKLKVKPMQASLKGECRTDEGSDTEAVSYSGEVAE